MSLKFFFIFITFTVSYMRIRFKTNMRSGHWDNFFSIRTLKRSRGLKMSSRIQDIDQKAGELQRFHKAKRYTEG